MSQEAGEISNPAADLEYAVADVWRDPTPHPMIVTPRGAQQVLRGLQGLNIIGGDVVEIAPQYDPTSNTAHVGAQMLFEILCLMTCATQVEGRGATGASMAGEAV